MGAEAGPPPDAAVGGERKERKNTFIISRSELMRGDFSFRSLDQSRLSEMAGDLWEQDTFDDHLPEVALTEDPDSPGGKRYKVIDGRHRVVSHPGDLIRVYDRTPALTRTKYRGQTVLTATQFLAEVRGPTVAQVNIAPERMALHYITEWKGIVKEAAGESSGLAAVILLGNEGVHDQTEARVRRYFRRDDETLLGEPPRLRDAMIEGLVNLHNNILRTNNAYDTIALQTFQTVASLTDSPESLALQQRQIDGLFTLAQVRRKITEGDADEEVIAQRRSLLTPLLIDAISATANDTEENASFRDALLHPRLSYDDLVDVLTPPGEGYSPTSGQPDEQLLSNRLDRVRNRINTTLLTEGYTTTEKNLAHTPPSAEVVQIMRNLSGRDVLSEGQVTAIAEIAWPLQEFIDETTTFISQLPQYIGEQLSEGQITQWTQGLIADFTVFLSAQNRSGITRSRVLIKERIKTIRKLIEEQTRPAEAHDQIPDHTAPQSASTSSAAATRPTARPAKLERSARPAEDLSTAASVTRTVEPIVLLGSQPQDNERQPDRQENEGTQVEDPAVLIGTLRRTIFELGANARKGADRERELRRANEELKTRVGEQQAIIEEQAGRLAEQEQTNADLTRRNEELTAQNTELAARVQSQGEQGADGDMAARASVQAEVEIVPVGGPSYAELLADRDKITRELAAAEKQKAWWEQVEEIDEYEKGALRAHSMGQGKAYRNRMGLSLGDYEDLLKSAWEKRADYARTLRDQRREQTS